MGKGKRKGGGRKDTEADDSEDARRAAGKKARGGTIGASTKILNTSARRGRRVSGRKAGWVGVFGKAGDGKKCGLVNNKSNGTKTMGSGCCFGKGTK